VGLGAAECCDETVAQARHITGRDIDMGGVVLRAHGYGRRRAGRLVSNDQCGAGGSQQNSRQGESIDDAHGASSYEILLPCACRDITETSTRPAMRPKCSKKAFMAMKRSPPALAQKSLATNIAIAVNTPRAPALNQPQRSKMMSAEPPSSTTTAAAAHSQAG